MKPSNETIQCDLNKTLQDADNNVGNSLNDGMDPTEKLLSKLVNNLQQQTAILVAESRNQTAEQFRQLIDKVQATFEAQFRKLSKKDRSSSEKRFLRLFAQIQTASNEQMRFLLQTSVDVILNIRSNSFLSTTSEDVKTNFAHQSPSFLSTTSVDPKTNIADQYPSDSVENGHYNTDWNDIKDVIMHESIDRHAIGPAQRQALCGMGLEFAIMQF